jgi:hypothetical protein
MSADALSLLHYATSMYAHLDADDRAFCEACARFWAQHIFNKSVTGLS